ncbi:hypothetical protein BDZ89DRAFT_1055503, partial [Hymenopellis radicata]
YVGIGRIYMNVKEVHIVLSPLFLGRSVLAFNVNANDGRMSGPAIRAVIRHCSESLLSHLYHHHELQDRLFWRQDAVPVCQRSIIVPGALSRLGLCSVSPLRKGGTWQIPALWTGELLVKHHRAPLHPSDGQQEWILYRLQAGSVAVFIQLASEYDMAGLYPRRTLSWHTSSLTLSNTNENAAQRKQQGPPNNDNLDATRDNDHVDYLDAHPPPMSSARLSKGTALSSSGQRLASLRFEFFGLDILATPFCQHMRRISVTSSRPTTQSLGKPMVKMLAHEDHLDQTLTDHRARLQGRCQRQGPRLETMHDKRRFHAIMRMMYIKDCRYERGPRSMTMTALHNSATANGSEDYFKRRRGSL